MKIKSFLLSAFGVLALSSTSVFASGLLLDATIGDVIGENPAASVLGVRWGTWDGTNFTVASGGNSTNNGYLDITGDELSSSLSSITNAGFNLSNGSQLDLVIYYAGVPDSSNTPFSSSFTNYAVLRDAGWLVPTFSSSPSLTPITFSTNTQALVGSINTPTTAGATSITLVPEPSTYALMAVGGLVLFFIARRRKAQQV